MVLEYGSIGTKTEVLLMQAIRYTIQALIWQARQAALQCP